ncbi:MAG: GNAT family N-acetyltransferase [Flavobacteriaceae bacterium]|nr:GNAT family N-acetyltransferase [Flavobacteriaceae bacterium]
MKAEIIPYQPDFKTDFVRLNIAWLEEFFEVEPIDKEVLNHCEDSIIQKGGFIFFAKSENSILGTCAFIKIESHVFELTKMAVDKNYRGQGIGQLMLDHAVAFAEKHHWKKLILYSNTLLENAIYLYRKSGFIEVPLEKDCVYKRGNIKMELVF